MYSGHSIKRGSVQLYRYLGLGDEMVLEIFHMSGHHAFANYCAAYNYCAPTELLYYASGRDYIAYAQTVAGETDIVYDEPAFEEWLKEMKHDELAKKYGFLVALRKRKGCSVYGLL